MRVLGVDPGTLVMGYGVIESEANDLSLVEFGAIRTKERSSIGERLRYLYDELVTVIVRLRPAVVAVEQPFVAKNARSAFAIGRAQAVAILAAANNGLSCYEYSPAEVKQRIANYGSSSKEQVQQMVMLQLQMDKMPTPPDAADALAVALCHLQEAHVRDLLEHA